MSGLNANPIIYHTKSSTRSITLPTSTSTDGPLLTTFYTEEKSINEDEVEQIDALEIFDMLRNINDPEHPLTLEQLNVAQLDQISVDHATNHIRIRFTPTIPHCSMATLIGLCLRVKLIRSLPPRYKIDISISPGTHASEDAVNKQLSDKERVAAALENTHLLDVVNKCIAHTDPIPEEIQTLLQ